MRKTKYIGYRPTWAEVDLGNLAYNFRQVRKRLAPGVKVMSCVKADAYGHGLVPVAQKLVSCGVDYLSVASLDEAIKLREAGVLSPILVLGIVLKKDIAPLFRYDLTQTVCDRDLADTLNSMARRLKKPICIHIKVDTGMGRLGVLHKDALKFVKYAHTLKFINIEGLFTHLACADTNRDFTLAQINDFAQLISGLKKCGINIPLLHAANSIGIIDYRQSHFNMVRPGLIIYGLYPTQDSGIRVKPVLSLKTLVVYFKKVPAQCGISYGHTYVTRRAATIVNLPIGYGDGYPRNLSNRAPVLIRGQRFRISGRVCMDQIMVDVGDLAVKQADEAVLIGRQGKHKITVEELAVLSDTIPYEIVCGFGSRVPRVYV